jgi:alanine racemase
MTEACTYVALRRTEKQSNVCRTVTAGGPTLSNVPYEYLDTPCVLLDLNQLDANIREMTQYASDAGISLRPHTKVHQSAWIAQRQLEAGACGIEVGTLDQAEVMAREGIHDIVVGHPFYGRHKLETLRRIISNPVNGVTLVVDMMEQAQGIVEVAQQVNRTVPVLLKIDTGAARLWGTSRCAPRCAWRLNCANFVGIKYWSAVYGHEQGAKTPTRGWRPRRAKMRLCCVRRREP